MELGITDAEAAVIDGAAVDRDGREPFHGLTCFGNAEYIPYCAGVDCPEWGDCHGDRLRGYSVTGGAGALS